MKRRRTPHRSRRRRACAARCWRTALGHDQRSEAAGKPIPPRGGDADRRGERHRWRRRAAVLPRRRPLELDDDLRPERTRGRRCRRRGAPEGLGPDRALLRKQRAAIHRGAAGRVQGALSGGQVHLCRGDDRGREARRARRGSRTTSRPARDHLARRRCHCGPRRCRRQVEGAPRASWNRHRRLSGDCHAGRSSPRLPGRASGLGQEGSHSGGLPPVWRRVRARDPGDRGERKLDIRNPTSSSW